jgi:hypothetical protein
MDNMFNPNPTLLNQHHEFGQEISERIENNPELLVLGRSTAP